MGSFPGQEAEALGENRNNIKERKIRHSNRSC
jgi:hypothetical protein